MDLATVIGLVLCLLLVLGAIATGDSPKMFVNASSLMIVVGGTIGATLMRNPLATVIKTFAVVMKAFMTKLAPPAGLIDQVVDMARTARKDSLLSLEKVKIDDPFLAKGIQLCVDGLEPAQLRGILETDIVSTGNCRCRRWTRRA